MLIINGLLNINAESPFLICDNITDLSSVLGLNLGSGSRGFLSSLLGCFGSWGSFSLGLSGFLGSFSLVLLLLLFLGGFLLLLGLGLFFLLLSLGFLLLFLFLLLGFGGSLL